MTGGRPPTPSSSCAPLRLLRRFPEGPRPATGPAAGLSFSFVARKQESVDRVRPYGNAVQSGSGSAKGRRRRRRRRGCPRPCRAAPPGGCPGWRVIPRPPRRPPSRTTRRGAGGASAPAAGPAGRTVRPGGSTCGTAPPVRRPRRGRPAGPPRRRLEQPAGRRPDLPPPGFFRSPPPRCCGSNPAAASAGGLRNTRSESRPRSISSWSPRRQRTTWRRPVAGSVTGWTRCPGRGCPPTTRPRGVVADQVRAVLSDGVGPARHVAEVRPRGDVRQGPEQQALVRPHVGVGRGVV